MTLLVAMIADDLTGALDASAPFVLHGLKTVVARRPEAIEAALAEAPDVLCVSTATREMDGRAAAEIVRLVAARLRRTNAKVLFKKVDSRLKGPVAAELQAALSGFGLTRAVIAPAIPDLGRIVSQGQVLGQGIDEAIDVLARTGGAHEVPDTPDQAALAAVAQGLLAEPVLAVGARGLALAFASLLGHPAHATDALELPRPLVIAIGSRDPITRRQVDAVMGSIQIIEAPNGGISGKIAENAVLVITTESRTKEPIQTVAKRFAEGVARLVRGAPPATLLLSGGETAYAILDALQVDVLIVGGEALPGIPWCRAIVAGHPMMILTKSGGFGGPETISLLAGLPVSPILHAESQ